MNVLTKKLGPFLDPFLPKIWSFLLKSQVFGHFLQNRTSDLSKTWSETWDSWFESLNGNVSRKILALAVLAICDIIWFWAVFGHSLPNRWCFFVFFCYLGYVYCLKMVNENFCSDKKIGAIFYPFLVQILAIFAQKSGFQTFSSKPQIFLKLCQKLCTIALNYRV